MFDEQPDGDPHGECAAEIERLRQLLREAAALFRFYEHSHRAKGPGHEEKVRRNASIAGRIEDALGRQRGG